MYDRLYNHLLRIGKRHRELRRYVSPVLDNLTEFKEGSDTDLPDTLYHGTSFPRFREMKQDWETELIYLADSRSGAVGYATQAAREDGGVEKVDSVIVEFDLETLARQGGLLPDYDDVRSNLHLFEDAFEADQVFYTESLEVLGTCSYRGPLQEAYIDHEIIS